MSEHELSTEDMSSASKLEAALSRIEDACFEESFAVHERMMNGGRTLADMLSGAVKNGGVRLAATVLAARAEGLSEEGLKPDKVKRYARYAAAGIFPPKTVDRIIDRAMLMKRYPSLDDKFETATDSALHIGSLRDGLRRHEKTLGLKLGIGAIDALINSGYGAMPGETFHIVGAEGSMKTALALNALCMYVKAGGRALYISLDMSPERIEERILLRLCGMGLAELREEIRRGGPKYEDAVRAREKELAELKVMGGPLGIEGVRAAVLASDAGVVALDYVTAIDGMESELDASRAMAALGRDLTHRWEPVLLLLSQMSWDSQRDKERGGRGGHAMGGGSLGQFADFEVELFRDRPIKEKDSGDKHEPLVATLRKNRSGMSGVSFEIFPEYPSLKFKDKSRKMEFAVERKALFKPVKVA